MSVSMSCGVRGRMWSFPVFGNEIWKFVVVVVTTGKQSQLLGLAWAWCLIKKYNHQISPLQGKKILKSNNIF